MPKHIPTLELLNNTVILAVKSPSDHKRTTKFLIRRGNAVTAIGPGSFALWCNKHNINYSSAMSQRSKCPNREIHLHLNISGSLTLFTLLPKNSIL